MPPGQSYPSPDRAQAGSGAYFGQNGPGSPSRIPDNLEQLSTAEMSRNTAPMMAGSSGGGQDMGHHGQPMYDDKYQPSASEQAEQERLAQTVMSLNDQSQFSDTSPAPRKRSKVSRACDECRRKKIRCDATADAPADPCSSCKRTGAPCQFSRQPMKRGPSKGYIKELADRLNALEGQIGPGQAMSNAEHSQYMSALNDESMASRLGEINDFSPPPGSGLSRKRTHSMSENFPPYAPSRPSDGYWPADPQRHLPPPQTPRTAAAESQKYAQFSPNGMRYGGPDSAGRRESAGIQFDESLAAALEWDESVVDEYYRIIHPSFPMLPNDKTRLQIRLANCPVALRNAFLAVLDSTVRSSPTCRLLGSSSPQQSMRKASELIAASQFESLSGRPLSNNLIYLHALILMALESDNHGPAAALGGMQRTEWIARAIGVACHLRLDVPPPKGSSADTDPDSDEKLGRRTWAVLVILGHWHAISTATTDQVPAASGIFIPEENLSLGNNAYHLARLSRVMGHLSRLLRESSTLGMSPARLVDAVSESIVGELTFFRESVEPFRLDDISLVYISYWHFQLLVLRYTPSTTPSDLLDSATRLADKLSSANAIVSPLYHHFAALATLTLLELCDVATTRRGAEQGLDEVLEALNTRRSLMSREEPAWDAAVRELINKKKVQLAVAGDKKGSTATGLQHLADAAIGGAKKNSKAAAAEATDEAGAIDRGLFLDKGYLGELGALAAT